MAYGLKCWSTGTAYVAPVVVFDSTTMDSYLKVTAAGKFVGPGTSPVISADGLYQVYVFATPPSYVPNNYNLADQYDIINKTSNSFKIQAYSAQHFSYIAFTR